MEMDLKFKPGDVVQLNSGGPRMTVVAVTKEKAPTAVAGTVGAGKAG